jgi:hypothetical protein
VSFRESAPSVPHQSIVVPAAQVHTAFMAALRFGYAMPPSSEEYPAKKAGQPQERAGE